MPYRDPEQRRAANMAAKRRYQSSPKGKAAAHRYYLSRKVQQLSVNPAPLAQAIANWRPGHATSAH